MSDRYPPAAVEQILDRARNIITVPSPGVVIVYDGSDGLLFQSYEGIPVAAIREMFKQLEAEITKGIENANDGTPRPDREEG